MLKSLPFLMGAWCLMAQIQPPLETGSPYKVPADKAPAEVNEALTKRVNGFYQAHVDGKFRLAEQFVAEEQREDYYAVQKTRYEGFEIMKTAFTEDFKRAEVTVATKGTWMVRAEKMVTKVPITTHWKLVDGQWYWFSTPATGVSTPFGTMHFNSGAKADGGARSALPADPSVLAQRILSSVKVDKESVMLSSYEASKGEFKVSNGLAGSVQIRIDTDGTPKELVAVADKTTLGAGEVATVKLSYTPLDSRPKPTGYVRISVDPINVVLPVKVMFAIQPELEKQLPKSLQPGQQKP